MQISIANKKVFVTIYMKKLGIYLETVVLVI